MDTLRLFERLKSLEALIQIAIAKSSGVISNAFVQGGNSFGATAVLGTNDANILRVITNTTARAEFDLAGNFVPPADNTGQVGTAARRWNLVRATTVTTGDLIMLDDAGEAHWTLKEHSEHLFAHNAKTGKSYKLLMEEIPSPGDFAMGTHGAHARAAEAEAEVARAETARLEAEAAEAAAVEEAKEKAYQEHIYNCSQCVIPDGAPCRLGYELAGYDPATYDLRFPPPEPSLAMEADAPVADVHERVTVPDSGVHYTALADTDLPPALGELEDDAPTGELPKDDGDES